ncbi:MAG TPA: dihydrolipoamide acetyltransferase family protein [Desulfomonilaceae bacterium]|nr:dihydrolipoamide acetyltransferase family protein [Desulfomonilaceae bacterium]
MRQAFKLPDVGEGIAQAEIVEYLVNVGDQIKADQPVVRIETDKAVVELPSPYSGTVVEIPHNPGDSVNVGEVILVVETEALAEASPRETPEKAKPPAEPKAPAAGAIAEEPTAEKKTKAPPREPVQASQAEPQRVLATPHTRKLARELKVDITTITGTGTNGRITDEDVKRAAEQPVAAAPKMPEAKAPTAAAVQAPATAGFDFEKYGPTKRTPLKGVRKRTAEVMVRSVSTIPHVTHFDDADVTELMHVVERERALAESRNVRLTILAFVAKAAASALKLYPILNSSLDEETCELVFKDYYNIGFATDTEAGLMVPVVRDVDKKSVLQIASDLQDLSKKARDRSIELDDMRGGTFTITNIGSVGGKWATPIIVHPQVAILCTMRATPQPVVHEGDVVIRTIMPLTLSFDHRVLDGAEAARFTNFVRGLLEDPMRMLVDIS